MRSRSEPAARPVRAPLPSRQRRGRSGVLAAYLSTLAPGDMIRLPPTTPQETRMLQISAYRIAEQLWGKGQLTTTVNNGRLYARRKGIEE